MLRSNQERKKGIAKKAAIKQICSKKEATVV